MFCGFFGFLWVLFFFVGSLVFWFGFLRQVLNPCLPLLSCNVALVFFPGQDRQTSQLQHGKLGSVRWRLLGNWYARTAKQPWAVEHEGFNTWTLCTSLVSIGSQQMSACADVFLFSTLSQNLLGRRQELREVTTRRASLSSVFFETSPSFLHRGVKAVTFCPLTHTETIAKS